MGEATLGEGFSWPTFSSFEEETSSEVGGHLNMHVINISI